MENTAKKKVPAKSLWILFLIFLILMSTTGIELPRSCLSNQFYDTGSMICRNCSANTSMVTSKDGFGCVCEEHSIPFGIERCKPCNATEIVSADGTACVPRRCQNISGKFVCKKCPNDYISVTQNFDGLTLKEVQCVKCSRGYKPLNNVCAKCESCVCSRSHLVIRGVCVPKSFVNERPKYDKTELHPLTLLDIVKNEYLCTKNNYRSCRYLANQCVKNYYVSHPAGPCRLWLQQHSLYPEGLPQLNIQSTDSEKTPGEIHIPRSMSAIVIAMAVHTSNGGIVFLKDVHEQTSPCFPLFQLTIGKDMSLDCTIDLSKLKSSEFNETLAVYTYIEGDLKQLPITIRKPDGYKVEKGNWMSSRFSRYFLVNTDRSITSNANYTEYIRNLIIYLWIERDKYNFGGLRIRLSAEAQYATQSSESSLVLTTFNVKHEMPSAGIFRSFEVWSGVLGALFLIYGLVQWRGSIRRGSRYYSLIPLLSNAVADTLYFSVWFSTLHTFAAERSTFGYALPPAKEEEYTIICLLYTAVFLKAIRVVWLNFNQCKSDIFFLDWNVYNTQLNEQLLADGSDRFWKINMLAKEWCSIQTTRKVSPPYLITLTLLMAELLKSSIIYLQDGKCYKWTIVTIFWWSSYCLLFLYGRLYDRIFSSPLAVLSKICTGVNLSIIVFQEEYYAHYVHGRKDDIKDVRSLSGPLSTCRIICAPRLRSVYKKLSMDEAGALNEVESSRVLLSRFLAAFFEKALDGLNWVASERTLLEKLLDVEIATRESGNTSILLYDEYKMPSCFAVTWLGEEWSLATFDAMLFSSLMMAADDVMLAGLVTILFWQIMKSIRTYFGIRNVQNKINVELI